MYCQSCGIAIGQAMRFCNRCGTSVVAHDPAEAQRLEKRLDNYLDGLFWITAIGVALTGGGLLLLKKAEFSERFLLAFLILSATAFLVNFGLSLWVVRGIHRSSKPEKALTPSPTDTHELDPMRNQPALQPAASVTENTTRSFEPLYNKRNSD
ncbi:MAG TPA: hypothetical protein VFH15_08280 [Pyrinomonadaceae bacterium]|nr:hypothetical protein [Pyrinomonadaceae bacterium]